MHIKDLQRRHVRIDKANNYVGYEFKGKKLQACEWADNAPHGGAVCFCTSKPTDNFVRSLYKGRGKDDWYFSRDFDESENKEDVFEGPYPFDVMKTVLAFEDYIEAY